MPAIKKEEDMPPIKKEEDMPVTKKEHTPVIKKEPGTEESLPLHVIAQANPKTESAKRKARSESPPTSAQIHPESRREREGEMRLVPLPKPKDTEVWQYLMTIKPNIYMPRCVTKDKAMCDLLQLFPHKRDLPEVWKTRLVLEGAGPGNLRLIFAYLVGDEAGSAVCGPEGSNCAEKWLTVDPAMAASLVEGNETIHKAAAFPRCILFPELRTSGSSSGKRECVNATYRESKDLSMPEIWSSSAPAPARDPASLHVSSLAGKKRRRKGRAGRG